MSCAASGGRGKGILLKDTFVDNDAAITRSIENSMRVRGRGIGIV